MGAVERSNVIEAGQGDGQPMIFAHGFGCDQHMWFKVAPRFEDRYRVLSYDLAGYGGSDLGAYDPERHGSLHGYAADLVDIIEELDLLDLVFVGHSVAAMIGALAARAVPERFARLVMVGPSPRYIDDANYVGGFSESDISDLISSLSQNYLGWSSAMAPVIMGNPDRPDLGDQLIENFCRADPDVARRFAEVTFLSDTRSELPLVEVPTLVLQCSHDVIAPMEVGAYVVASMPNATMSILDATGHCPNLSAPDETYEAIAAWLSEA